MGKDKKAFPSLLEWIKSGAKRNVQETEEVNAKMDLLSMMIDTEWIDFKRQYKRGKLV